MPGEAGDLGPDLCQRMPEIRITDLLPDVAFREIGRVERTLFMIEWLLDVDMQRRAGLGPNKGEARHALKNALRIGRQGEIRERTSGARHFRIAGLNLLTAIIICWNTEEPGRAVRERELADLDAPADLLAHVSPPGWAHILFTGECRWRRTVPRKAQSVISHRAGIDPMQTCHDTVGLARIAHQVKEGSGASSIGAAFPSFRP